MTQVEPGSADCKLGCNQREPVVGFSGSESELESGLIASWGGYECEPLQLRGDTPQVLMLSWPATVRHIEHLGADCIVYADVRGVGSMTVRTEGEPGLQIGQHIHLSPRAGLEHRFRGGQRVND